MLDMMIGKRRLLTAMGAAVVLAAITGPAAWAADAKGDPEQWIVEISNKILEDIRTDAQLSQADPARVRRFVDEQIMPVVDFERMTRTAVGPKWRQATKEQRKELMDLFREQLIRVGRALFASKGFEAVSVEEIAANAKVSKPIVYEHFGGKEGLYAKCS